MQDYMRPYQTFVEDETGLYFSPNSHLHRIVEETIRLFDVVDEMEKVVRLLLTILVGCLASFVWMLCEEN